MIKKSSIDFIPIFSGKLRRYFSWQNFIDPFFVLLGFFQSFFILLRFRPQLVFSKGGYVSLPVVFSAFLLRIPIILHESDRRMGLANRIASKMARWVCVAFPDLVKSKKYRLTGNPIRSNLKDGDSKKAYQMTKFSKNLPILLVWGGSQGALEINQMIEADFDRFVQNFQIIHITGLSKAITKKHEHYLAFTYLDDTLKDIYSITDLVIGRAGANSLYELAYLEKPNIIIPLSNSDQLENARYFKKMGASLVYEKNHSDSLFDLTYGLWQNKNLINTMKKSLISISKNNANQLITKLIFDTI